MIRTTQFYSAFLLLTWTPWIAGGSQFNSINKKDNNDYNPSNGNSNGNGNGGGGLFPNVFNLATRAHITVNATCGESEPEVYCKLVEHVLMRAPQCGVCDAASTDSTKRHPKEHAIDGTPRWWQSPSLQYGQKYEWVTITLDLKQTYQIYYVIVKSAISPRPANWILERSLDNVTYRPWQYYAQTDDECWSRYGIQPSRGIHVFKSDSDVICTSAYSKLNPLEGGEIHTSLVKGRPGANVSSAELRDFTLARFVRLRLQKIRTLNAEFMSISPGLDDASVTRRLFYSIKDISIGGHCVCSGHAVKCQQNPKQRRPQCECQHNTCGASCEQCCPLFNQVQWRAGTPDDSAECEACQCHGHATACVFDQSVEAAGLSLDTKGQRRGGGVCVSCMSHTAGINCEHCEDGWYRPTGILPDNPSPCRPCDCHLTGSSGHCVKDETQGMNPGTCICREGFGGQHCDRCAPGFRNFPECTPCPCDPRGTRLDDCEERCNCKVNAEGERCDRCKVGHFGLSVDNEEGCSQCYCSGVGTICQGADLRLEDLSTYSSWQVSDLRVTRTVVPSVDEDTEQLVVGNYELPGVESYYWLAPAEYLGNRLPSYGSEIESSVTWVVMRGDTSGKPTTGPDCILVGSNGVRLASGDTTYESRNTTIRCPLRETAWYFVPDSVQDIVTRLRRNEYHGGAVTRSQLMAVLADVQHLLIRAKFHTDQVEGGLWETVLPSASAKGSGALARYVERCLCPPGYSGLSCESCDYGYVRVLAHGTRGEAECRKCNCNGHAASCDAVTGECSVCDHNADGPNCETCVVGYYGDATRSTCNQCACPMTEEGNNFSPTCEISRDEDWDSDSPAYVCTNCPIGFAGVHCETCAAGFFGDPRAPGSTCKPCDCNGGACDAATGQCLGCQGNTEGWKCDKCKENHYGDPAQKDCIACECNAEGSSSAKCDAETGQCLCRERHTGRTCDRCQPGLGNITAGCVPCRCNDVGSSSAECDAVTGQCPCRPGVGGAGCDSCLQEHYGFSDQGCIGCNCSAFGAVNTTCAITSGQCVCKPHATGLKCDTCEPGFWGLGTSGRECQKCECDIVGTERGSCDARTGACLCRRGVTGPKCDRCLPDYYGFSARGCSVCERCDKPGHMCDPDTGRCVCPSLTQGPSCNLCAPNSWGYEPGKGCKPCACDTTAAVRRQCDVNTGRCTCREGFEGNLCERCASGFHSYPNCRRCDCHVPGTLPEHCNVVGQCTCDAAGQCPCKANVAGKKCSACKDGMFGLSADNADGCTQCFCFGRTTHCTQAGLTWGQIVASLARSATIIESGTETLTGVEEKLDRTGKLPKIPGTVGNLFMGVSSVFDTPIYWQLPKQFLGDKVLSYGGFLRFGIETKGSNHIFPHHILSTYPLVQLQGNGRMVLDHFPLLPPNVPGRYEVRLHESLWRMDRGKVTREMLMVALQNVDHILVRATDRPDVSKLVLRNATLDTAIMAQGQPPPLARGIEMCECPAQYNSTSCQDPSIGFYRHAHNNSISSTIIIQTVGEAIPCQCNRRSGVCDIETGHCLNCADNTGGAHCEKCAEGFYGDPALGPCLSCPCPTPGRNFARSCRVGDAGQVNCHCKEGYTGKLCDRCSYGWYGWPQREGGSCSECLCNPVGSVSDECHEETGQCNCRPGITGRDCSMCDKRYILTDNGCKSCDDGCTGVLLDDIAKMSSHLDVGAGHLAGGFIPPPWTPLLSVENSAHGLEAALARWNAERDQTRAKLNAVADDDLKKKAKQVLNKAGKLAKKCDSMAKDSATFRESTDRLLAEAIARSNDLNEVVSRLENYGQGKAGAISPEAAMNEARTLLQEIRNTDFSVLSNNAQNTLKKCKNLVNYIKSLLGNRSGLENVRLNATEFDRRLNDLSKHLKSSAELLVDSKNYAGRLQNRLSNLKSKLQEAVDLKEDIDDLVVESGMFVEEGAFSLDEANKNIKEFNDIEDHFANLTRVLEKRESLLDRLNPLYREKYVIPAQKHAEALLKRALGIRDMFSTTRRDADFALRASQAYKNIVDALEKARQAAIAASKAADVAYQKAYPLGTDSLLERSSIVRADSSRLISRAEIQWATVKDLKERLIAEKEDVDTLRDSVRTAAHDDISISKDLSHLGSTSTNVNKTASDALARSKNLINSMEKVTSFATEIAANTTAFLRPKLKELDSDLQLNTVENHITGTRGNVKQSNDLLRQMTDVADERREKFRAWNDTLASKLQELRNKIKQARNTANGIHLSLTSQAGGGCHRSFKVKNQAPSTTSSIVMTYGISTDEKDASLLYLPSSNTKDFIALEMVNRRIRFLWDLGGGTGVVTSDLEIKTGNLYEDKTWYTIDVTRTSNLAQLTVRPSDKPEGFVVRTVENITASGFGRLDVGPNDKVFVGRLPEGRTIPPQLLAGAAGFSGCIHKVALDGRSIGLWNFQTDSDQCTACIDGVEEVVDVSSYWFDGDGYTVLHPSTRPDDRRHMSVSLKFRTLDENALLFLALNSENNHFLSVALVHGHVVLRIRYAGESRLEITSTEKYNSGNWTNIEAIRHYDRNRKVETGLLKVDIESHQKAPVPPPRSYSDLPDLANAKYYIGGVPPGFEYGPALLDLPGSYLGCMSDILVTQQGYNPLNGNFSGIESSCPENRLRMAGFFGGGHLQLPSHSLKKVATFGMVFRTVNPNALIMLSTHEGFPGISGYYSASLLGGKLEIRVDAGAGEVALLSDLSLADGRFHTFSVEKRGRRLELRVDDEVQSNVTLPSGNVVVRSPEDKGGLYLGGLPEGLNATHMVAALEPLVGTIKDVIFDDTLIYFDKPLSFDQVEIGRSGPNLKPLAGMDIMIPDVMPQPRGTHNECHKVTNYALEPGAVKFGDLNNSHVHITFKKRSVLQKDYEIEFDFRTFYPNGLLFVIPAARNKKSPYMVANLENKQLKVVVQGGKRKMEALATLDLNDGTWHRVTLTKQARELRLTVDDINFSPIKYPKKLNIGNSMYLGGLPSEGVHLPDQVLRLERFKGCIRSLAVNKQRHDLVGDKARHFGVSQCFPHVEQGSYFPGDAYAVYQEKFRVGALLHIELSFRTSEMTGVLLSVSEPEGFPALSLELNEGKVVMTGDMGDMRPFNVNTSFSSEFAVCDNKWHHINAEFINDELTLQVDNNAITYGHPTNGNIEVASTNSPLYIGGLPDYASSGTLQTRDNFKGCIRNVIIGGKRLDWTDMADLHHILLSSCPVST